MLEFDMAPTRIDTYNLLKVFNRHVFPDEYIQYKSTEVLTKKIIANVKHLNLEAEHIKFLKTNKFKDVLFLLLKHNFTTEELKHVANVKITEKYKDILTKLNSVIFDDLLNNLNSKYDNISIIIIAYVDYICNDLNLDI